MDKMKKMEREIEQIKNDLWTVKKYLKDFNDTNKIANQRVSMIQNL